MSIAVPNNLSYRRNLGYLKRDEPHLIFYTVFYGEQVNDEAVTKAKQSCYPENISVMESKAEVYSQDVIDHTIKRLLLNLQEIFE